jgi:hypothetical protein
VIPQGPGSVFLFRLTNDVVLGATGMRNPTPTVDLERLLYGGLVFAIWLAAQSPSDYSTGTERNKDETNACGFQNAGEIRDQVEPRDAHVICPHYECFAQI